MIAGYIFDESKNFCFLIYVQKGVTTVQGIQRVGSEGALTDYQVAKM